MSRAKLRPLYYHPAPLWLNTVQNVVNIRNMTCFRIQFQFFIHVRNVQGFPEHTTFCITPISCTLLQSPTFLRALPCRICRFKFCRNCRCNKIISACQLFSWVHCGPLNVLAVRWYILHAAALCALFRFWGVKCDEATACVALFNLLVQIAGLMFLKTTNQEIPA